MKQNKLYLIFLTAPWIIIFLLFWAYPLVYSFILSLSEYKTLSGQISYIGFQNYIDVFNDDYFWNALINTIIFTFGTVPVTTALALFLAVMVNDVKKFKGYFKSAFFLPSVTSLVVISLIFTNLYFKDGYLNGLLQLLGLPYAEKGFLLEPGTALFSIMAMDVWIAAGYYMILFLSGMQTISKDLYDNAKLMGASSWNQFINITLPLLKPTLLFVLIINTIKSFQVFIEIYVMTKGGPLGSTNTLVYSIFDKAFNQFDQVGYASAIAYILFVILLIMSFLQSKLLSEK